MQNEAFWAPHASSCTRVGYTHETRHTLTPRTGKTRNIFCFHHLRLQKWLEPPPTPHPAWLRLKGVGFFAGDLRGGDMLLALALGIVVVVVVVSCGKRGACPPATRTCTIERSRQVCILDFHMARRRTSCLVRCDTWCG